MAGNPTVALSGYMFGPTVSGSGNPDERTYMFDLTHPSQPKLKITVNWRDIRWIDAYPHEPGGTTGGDLPHHLGRRTIWLDSESPQVTEYLDGDLIKDYLPPGDNLAGWNGPEQLFGAGPMGTTYPPCLCPR